MPTRLTIELVPRTSWGNNVRSMVSPDIWYKLRRDTYTKAGYRCEICGKTGAKHPTEAHEIWLYNDVTHTQTLTGLMALCPMCHSAKHIGNAQRWGTMDKVIAHLCKVNNWTLETTIQYIKEAFEEWETRSKHKWKVNVDILKGM
jgi:hypothetical protein